MTLLEYMREREAVRLRRKLGQPWPWTDDPILQKYKFTNVRRGHDRTTRDLQEIYAREAHRSRCDIVLYNCALYRYFGTSSFARKVGWCLKHDMKHISRVVKEMREFGEQVFTGAYIVTNCGLHGPKEQVVGTFLESLWNVAGPITRVFFGERSWCEAYRLMVQVFGFGGKGFYAKEALLDFLFCYPNVAKDELTWTPVGPGARRGLNRIHERPLKFDQKEAKFIEEVRALHELVQLSWREPLSLHDIQWNLCEFDKYERVRLGQGRPRSLYHAYFHPDSRSGQ